MEVMGQKAGWMHATVTRDDDEIRTTNAMKMSVDRAGVELVIQVESTFAETLDGEGLWASARTSFGGQDTLTTYQFLDDGVLQKVESGGQSTQTKLPPIQGVWLTPNETRAFMTDRLRAEADTITVRTIDASVGIQPVTITYTKFEPTTLELLGRTVRAIRCESSNSATPGITSIEYLDEHGVPLRSEMNMGGMLITMVAADRELATSDIAAPELMTSLFISPDKPIPGARTLKRAAYLLRVPDGRLELPPQTGSQMVERVDEQTVRVRVCADRFQPAGDVDVQACLERSTMLDTEDTRLRELHDQALEGAGEGKAERAEALRRFVYRYIRKKGLGVGFASASEVARSCEGDCSEHGTLLAALLRVDGIPSRVVSGVVYVDEFAGSKAIFGYHMWTQALLSIEGQLRWVDLDATLPGSLSYDATHIALGLSTLADGEVINGLVSLAPLMGRLEISVESLD
ncbi:MAG: hypothetical protein Kow0022_02810 [Phycisphaerales bacterium]